MDDSLYSSLGKARVVLRAISMLDLVTSIIIFILWILDTSPNFMFYMMILFQIPHVFAWNTSLAVSCKMEYIPYILMNIILYLICILADIASVIWRGYIIATCSGCNYVAIVFAWIVIAFVLVLTGIDFMTIIVTMIIRDKLLSIKATIKAGPKND